MSATTKSYILRIANPDYEELVYNKRCYYTNIRRRFSKGDLVFFLMKKEVDSFIGFAVIDSTKELLDIGNLDEREFCIKNRWYRKIEFNEIYRFRMSLPLRLVFPGLHKLGRALHGLELNQIEVKRIFDLEEILFKDPDLLKRYTKQNKLFNKF